MEHSMLLGEMTVKGLRDEGDAGLVWAAKVANIGLEAARARISEAGAGKKVRNVFFREWPKNIVYECLLYPGEAVLQLELIDDLADATGLRATEIKRRCVAGGTKTIEQLLADRLVRLRALAVVVDNQSLSVSQLKDEKRLGEFSDQLGVSPAVLQARLDGYHGRMQIKRLVEEGAFDKMTSTLADRPSKPVPSVPPLSPLLVNDATDHREWLHGVRDYAEDVTQTLELGDFPRFVHPPVAERIAASLKALRIELNSSVGEFDLRHLEGMLALNPSLPRALRAMDPTHSIESGIVLIFHELFHTNQGISTSNYVGVGAADVVLEMVDFWADLMAIATLTRWEARVHGLKGKQRYAEFAKRWVTRHLSSMQAFDRVQHGTSIAELTEPRLRRYLAWIVQRQRLASVAADEHLSEMCSHNLVVQVTGLSRSTDKRGRLLAGSPAGTLEVMMASGPLFSRVAPPPHIDIAAAIEGIRTYDLSAAELLARYLVDQNARMLVPWKA
jgi:hypothetical protein